jgi:aminomethyltransferase
MDLDLSKFNIRQTNPIILGNAGLPKNLERYTIKGEGLLGIDVFKDDVINVINIEGRQELELTFFNNNGKNETLINKDLNKHASFIKHVLNYTNDKKSLIKKLKNKKIDLNKINSLNYFDEETPAGNEINFVIEKDGFAIFAAPGAPMAVDSFNVATDLQIYVTRKNKQNKKLESILPESLATTKNEFLIKDSSAVAYEIKKGDFIQIIDLYGRQCSDFMAFDSPQLQLGKELSIDSTATRSIVGGAYQMPGLY